MDLGAQLLPTVLFDRPAKMHMRIHVAIANCCRCIARLQITAAFGAT